MTYTKANQELRELAKDNGVFLYEIAAKMHMSASALSRLLREELEDDQQYCIRVIIYDIVKSR